MPEPELCATCGRGASTYFYDLEGNFVAAYCHQHARSRMKRARPAPPDFEPKPRQPQPKEDHETNRPKD
jgi:hypothetical protein